MTTKEVLKYFGGPLETAAALGIWPNTVTRWGKYPPMVRQYHIQEITGGALKIESVARKST